ncbi:acyl-coenzyme A thioesterase 13-like [Asterias amurensis]|uniref:acyl-coenzyme A thioesterase 13-like n=1 Tax=Asterias amurensis TaxID=7602 RepID=UPI003AB20EBE
MAASVAATTQAARQMLKMMMLAKRFDSVTNKVNLISASAGVCRCEMTVEAEQTNMMGTLHGGFIATLVDSLTTVAIMTTPVGVPGVSVDLSVSYLKAAKIGEKITMDAEVTKVGKTLAFTTASLINENGDVIAQGKHIKHIAGKRLLLGEDSS